MTEAANTPPGRPHYSRPAADVLGVLAGAGAPVAHPALVAALGARGYSKASAHEAIADCQRRGWIEHKAIRSVGVSSRPCG